MPTYAYACRDCDHNFEVVQSFSDPSLTVCPECGGKLRKVYNSVGVVFKGPGFYRTDSRDSSTTGKNSSTGGSATTSSSGSKTADTSAKSDKAASGSSNSASTTSSNSSSSSSSAAS